jgi:hypothetical protein
VADFPIRRTASFAFDIATKSFFRGPPSTEADRASSPSTLASLVSDPARLVRGEVVLVEGVDVQQAYAAAPALAAATTPPLVSAMIVSGLGVPGALLEVSAVAALSAERRSQSE